MPPKVIFRCDAGDAPEIGTGHIARSKTLASAIVKHGLVKQEDIFFYTRDDEGFNLGKKYLASSGIQFQELSGNKLKANSKRERDIIPYGRQDISEKDIVKHIRFLSDDKRAGRYPGTRGSKDVIAYLINQLKSYGVQPAGEGSSFKQTFSILDSVKLSLIHI